MKSKYMQVLAATVASGKSVKDSAAIAGCTESTAYSLSCKPEFKALVAKLRSEAVEAAVGVLTSNASAASNALVRLLDSDDEKIQLAAASKLLAQLGPLQELSELRSRIDALETSRHGQ
jgi:hypothetical protein